MLCVPDRESYRIQMPKFLTFRGCFSEIWKDVSFSSHPVPKMAAHTTLTLTISPVVFFTFWRPRRKYQKRDLATTAFGAKMRMR